jgi:2-keto-4-pentenoate hydratase/2-oxohepta-3-ene-1,7-dioic acid hydratase in catechol pathway
MKLALFRYGGRVSPGAVLPNGQILDLEKACEVAGITPAITSLADIIRSQCIAEMIRSTVAAADPRATINGRDVEFLAPLGPALPRNIFCVGRNYVEHVVEGHRARSTVVKPPEAPQFFTKPPSCIIGPTGRIPAHAHVTKMLDYEVELAVIIGKSGRDIPQTEAFEHVFGYSILNDLTARDLQAKHGQWFKGKSLDGHCVLGPWIVHRDSIPDPSNLALTLSVNGEQRQKAFVHQMIFDIPRIVADLSAAMTLNAGDIIATGTPSGVGFAMNPPRFLNSGDVVEAEISGLGFQRNEVVSTEVWARQ